MNNLRILLYMMLLSLAACHPEGTSVKQGLDKAAQLMEQDPDTASIILETIQSSQMNEAQLAEYNLLCTQLNEDKNIPHSSDKQIRQAASYYETEKWPPDASIRRHILNHSNKILLKFAVIHHGQFCE